MQYYVSANALSGGDGSQDAPFQRIQQAAELALPGDEVIVLPGIYRENVDPRHGGTEAAPIVYRSSEPLRAVISGAEVISNWEKQRGRVWCARVPNSLFTERNPFTTLVSGDWLDPNYIAHTGDVYYNGKSLYEVADLKKVQHPTASKASWDPAYSRYTWFAQQDPDTDETVIYASFPGKDPNKGSAEISVRSACFYPQQEGIGYITLSGFTICQAATQWAPPTAYQEGMVGPHWSKGWVIEDCEIYESKCSGISLGKYLQLENDNKWLKNKYKDGTQTERECILQAQREGWTKERIGSHTIRRCNIHDCGQTGIVGHLGGVFSVIEDNHIHHINNKQNLAGAEIGGIKMHAAIDCIYRRNHIHHCTRGIWLDWQAQGTRVTANLFHDNALPILGKRLLPSAEVMIGNGEDLFIEVSHGPTLVDHNLFLSVRAVKIPTQGVAMVHNLIAGSFISIGRGTNNGAKTLNSARYTPYHVPHRTETAGFMTFLHGDNRFYNNIFLQQTVPMAYRVAARAAALRYNDWDDMNITVGTVGFRGYPTFEEWNRQFEGYCGMGSPASDRYYSHLPIWTGGNVYFGGAKPWEKEENFYLDTNKKPSLTLKETPDGMVLETDLFATLPAGLCKSIDTETLGKAFEPEQKYENPDGTPIHFDTDYFGTPRTDSILPGPFARVSAVMNVCPMKKEQEREEKQETRECGENQESESPDSEG